jgi:GNAT superfamily N-acetyltransferase
MSDGIIYRKANTADVLKLSILFKQVYIQTYGIEGVSDEFANFVVQQFSIEKLDTKIKQYPDNMIVAVYKNNLVGVAEIEFEKQCPVNNIIAPELNKLYILEWFCGKGIGYRLLAEAEKAVKASGSRELWLWVLETNERAVSFYERQNYICIGHASFKMEVNSYENKVMLKQLG